MVWLLLLYAAVGVSASILLLHALTMVLPRRAAQLTAYFARLISSMIALTLAASYGVFASIFLRVAGYGGCSQWTTGRSFKWIMWYFTGVTFRINDGGKIEGGRRGGEEALLTRPAVFVGNHQSELDVLMLGCIFPKYCSVTAKKSLKWVPFLGWFMTLSKSVFIDRANRATARAAFDGAAKHMCSERQSVFIFPEGTRSYSEKPFLLPFKKGAFHLAIQAQVPIVPVVTANYSQVLNVKQRIFNAGIIDVSVLPPIPTKGLTAADADGLATRTRDAMLDELKRLAEYPLLAYDDPKFDPYRTQREESEGEAEEEEDAIDWRTLAQARAEIELRLAHDKIVRNRIWLDAALRGLKRHRERERRRRG